MHADFAELERVLADLERDIVHALEHEHDFGGICDCHHGYDPRPAGITLTVQ